ncbi:hypothetical protein O6H91_13G043100 [Diphasiastrum complanatum]|uniref:Uncharacterized protein n=1 Tax=Diphasiastrum complanatum TaxID=34168 RepID=A0ACC2BU39_DIPCM|nr:hypothetical protein O6H91_13G043100 [Diphasiastrum complanatum]
MLPLKGIAILGSVHHKFHHPASNYRLALQLCVESRIHGASRLNESLAIETVGPEKILRDIPTGTRLRRKIKRMKMANCTKRFALPSSHQASCAGGKLVLCEGPSCIFVGPLESAEIDRLEALYKQARDSYYSGRPLVIDEMYDKVETQLRWRGSKLVFKYPRCSLKRLSAYGDVEADPSQMGALACVWYVLLATGLLFAAGPPVCALNKVCFDAVHVHFQTHGVTAAKELSIRIKELLATAMCITFGVTIGVAAVSSLQGLWRGDLVAVKGRCPNCCEEVYAFVKVEVSEQHRHRTDCHVCEQPLLFQIKIECRDHFMVQAI